MRAALPSVLLLSLLFACEDVETLDCTEIGCTDGVELFFLRDVYEPGVYGVTVDMHGDIVTCQATIPLESDTTDGCNDPRVMLYLSGSMLDTAEQSVDGFFLDSIEASALAVTVTLDGEQIGYAAFEPDYQTLQPNGEDCEPTCFYASYELTLDG